MTEELRKKALLNLDTVVIILGWVVAFVLGFGTGWALL